MTVKAAAVMSTSSLPLASASSTAPWLTKVTVWSAALRLAMLRSAPAALVSRFTAPSLLKLLTNKASVSTRCAPPVPTVAVKLSSEVSRRLAEVPIPEVVTVKAAAVMSTSSLPLASASNTAPWLTKVTL